MLFALFLGGLLVYGAAFAWHMLARFDLVNLLEARETDRDDAFCYLQIAKGRRAREDEHADGTPTYPRGVRHWRKTLQRTRLLDKAAVWQHR